ncbi:MAG TPA: glutamine synthetase beta-grasp domain-containing protein, partial [Saprospiraceae bacterium]|nr:glutamine synthetase beta-grasp domain-containing protein [Saprospiraceae bacterium]
MAKRVDADISRVFKMIKDHGVKMIDFKFMDFPGQWQHFSVPVSQLSEDSFEEGFGFDGSSIRGWKAINESDMLIIPDARTAFIDQFIEVKTLSLT